MMPALDVVPHADVARRYGLHQWMSTGWTIFVHRGDLVVDRHLLVDWQREAPLDDTQAVLLKALWGKQSLRGEYAVVIDGNLTVEGSILNTNIDGGPALVVTGRTTARSLLAGGAYLSFGGEATFSEAVVATYNHGEIEFLGPVSAPLLINLDHAIYFGHASRQQRIGAYYNDMDEQGADDASDDDAGDEETLPAAIGAVVNPAFTTVDDIRSALEHGRPLLR